VLEARLAPPPLLVELLRFRLPEAERLDVDFFAVPRVLAAFADELERLDVGFFAAPRLLPAAFGELPFFDLLCVPFAPELLLPEDDFVEDEARVDPPRLDPFRPRLPPLFDERELRDLVSAIFGLLLVWLSSIPSEGMWNIATPGKAS
jgi:hypothetical protein